MPLYLNVYRRHVTVHCSLSAMTHAPFHASMLRLAQCMTPQGGGELVNAALLSLINEACVNVCSSRVNSSAPLVCRHDRVTREAGRVGLVGRDRGRRGYSVTLYLYIYTARLLVSVFSRCLIQACMPAGRPSQSAHLAPSAQAERLAVRVDRAYSSLPTCSPAPTVIAD